MTGIKLMACPDNRPSCGAGVCVRVCFISAAQIERCD